jgi:hypothetical protein
VNCFVGCLEVAGWTVVMPADESFADVLLDLLT